MRNIHSGAFAPAVLALAAILALGACNRSELATSAVAEPAAPAAAEPAPVPATASVGTLVVGGEGTERYLTDNAGRAVYVLEGDDTGTRCVDDCLLAWPVVGGAAPVSGVPEVDGALIGTTTRADGTVQVTYAGHPLYYFADDTDVGVTHGRDVSDTWGRWYLLQPSGEVLTAELADATEATVQKVSNPATTADAAEPATDSDY